MKKVLLLVLVLMGTTVSAVAQESERNAVYTVSVNEIKNDYHQSKQTVGSVIGDVANALLGGRSTKKYEGYEDAVRAAIVRGLTNTFRMNVIDGAFTAEEKKASNTMYIDGVINNVSTTQKTNYNERTKRSTTYFMGSVSVTLQFKDAHTDKVVLSPSFSLSEYDCSWLETEEKALDNALRSLSRHVRSYIDERFPLTANIIEGAREKKDKQKEVYIDLGSNDGVYDGLHFAVFIEKKVANKVARQKLGRLKVTAVEGVDISLCKVQSGGRDIKAALDEGQTLMIQSLD